VFAGRKRLARIDRHLDRGDELMEGIREELRLSREQRDRHQAAIERHFERSEREWQETRAVLGNLRDVCRSLAVAVDENTRVLRELHAMVGELRAEIRDHRAETRAQTEGLMHVLDALRRLGPGGEPATS
jgi:septal ring factor EnvC (AmiA/AmiB activator)